MGGGFSNSANASHTASDSTQFGGQVWAPQADYLKTSYNWAEQRARDTAGLGQPELQQGLGTLGQSGAAYGQSLQQLQNAGQYMQASQGGINAANAGYGQSMANLSGMANPNQVNPMLDVYSRRLGQDLNENILPGMRGQAAMGNQLGGSRDQIGQALATARTGQQLQDFGAQLYSEDQNRALAANQGLQSGAAGYLQGAGAMQNIGAGLGGLAQGMQGAGQGLTQNAGMYGDLANLSAQLPWANLQNFSAILGGPAMQDMGGQSTSRGRSWGGSMAGNFSL